MQGAQAKQRTRTMKEFNIDEMTTFEQLQKFQSRCNRRKGTIDKALAALNTERASVMADLQSIAKRLPDFQKQHDEAIQAARLKVIEKAEKMHAAQIKLREKMERLGIDPNYPQSSVAELEAAEKKAVNE